VQHAGQRDVLGPAGAAGDQPGVLLAQPGPADLGLGRGTAQIFTCDLSYDYVKINAEYTT